MGIVDLYCYQTKDRRQQTASVEYDRRYSVGKKLNVEVKQQTPVLDAKLDKDIVQLKSTFQAFLANVEQLNSKAHKNPFAGFEKPVLPKKEEKKNKHIDIAETALCLLPPTRKVIGAINAAKDHNLVETAGMAFRVANEGKEDIRDLITAFKKIDKEDLEYQHPFWFSKTLPVEKVPFLGDFLNDHDKTLFDLKPVKIALKYLGLKNIEYKGDFYKINGLPLAEILGRASLRVPVLGIILFGIMETPNILKEDDKPKETIKTAIKIITVMSCASIFGAVAGYYSKLLELICMSGGVLIGGKAAEKINNKLTSSF